MTTSTEQTPTFVWDRDYGNHEQVRPYMKQFLTLYQGMKDRGEYPYDDAFKGLIDGVAGSEHESTAIYLLQGLKSLDELDAQIAAFIDGGGSHLADADAAIGEQYRGSVVQYGYYQGGTGWRQYDNVRYMVCERESARGDKSTYLKVWKPRKRNPIMIDGKFLLKPTTK